MVARTQVRFCCFEVVIEILQRAVVDQIREHDLVLEELRGGVAAFMDERVANIVDPFYSRVVLQ